MFNIIVRSFALYSNVVSLVNDMRRPAFRVSSKLSSQMEIFLYFKSSKML